MPVSKRTRYEVLRRDNHSCRYCGATAPDATLTVDHVTPTALGGPDDPSNLVAACRDCNYGKASTSPNDELVADVSERAAAFGRALDAWTKQRKTQRRKRDNYVKRFGGKWDSWTWGGKGELFPRPSDWRETLWRFFESGLPIEELEDAVDIACGNETVHPDRAWRYMCGVAHRKVSEMHEFAADYMEVADGS